MKFKLDFVIPQLPKQLHIEYPIVMSGSCFAQHIAERLSDLKWNVCCNPNGIVFNPISVFEGILSCAKNLEVDENSIFQYNDMWHSWNHHGRFSTHSKEELISGILVEQQKAFDTLTTCKSVVLTLGSAWIYELADSKKIVANCHKVPSHQFIKRLLSVDEILHSFNMLASHPLLKDKQFIFTVSPVRYVRDGLVENNRSKALLLNAVHEIVSQYNHVHYFPAYEIVIDELRDYRFFEEDMVHPNKMAIDYVFEKFADVAIDKESKELMVELTEVNKAYLHRPINAQTDAHAKFMKTYEKKVSQLKTRFPFLDMEKELNYFKQ